MANVGPRILDEIVRAIVVAVDPEQVILFGSRAHGASTEESDVDLVIVESEPFNEGRSRRKETTRIWQALAPFDVAKDILVYSSDEVERWRDSLNHVLARALRDGKVLYERH